LSDQGNKVIVPQACVFRRGEAVHDALELGDVLLALKMLSLIRVLFDEKIQFKLN